MSSVVQRILVLLHFFLLTSTTTNGLVNAAVVQSTEDTPKCNVILTPSGVPAELDVGESWSVPGEPCIRHTCQLTDSPADGDPTTPSNRTAVVVVSREQCSVSCQNEFELVPRPDRCCGECVQTKCRVSSTNNTAAAAFYAVGDMWKTADGCTFNECVRTGDDSIAITSYRKTCAPLAEPCPRSRLVQHDCCPACSAASSARAAPAADPPISHTFNATENAILMDPDTYLRHPCARDCQSGAAPMVCNYTFLVEWYETMSKACFDCPSSAADCERPHCIVGDGALRTIVTVNRMMPGPRLQVCLGDTLQVDVVNRLMGESTTVHWHGMHQRETPFMDGVPMVSQCPIAPHTTFRYTFRADHEGTHWWHSHTGMQRSDGALGALIVRRPTVEMPPAVRQLYTFDEPAHTMIVQDWEHVSAVTGFNRFHHSLGSNKPKNILINARGRYAEPEPLESAPMPAAAASADDMEPTTEQRLLNDVDARTKRQIIVESKFAEPSAARATPPLSLTPLTIFRVAPGGAGYRFRHINAGFLNCPVEISIDGHNLTVIASDGWYFEPVEVATLVTYAGERFDFVVRADQPIGNYWVRVRGLMDCDERFQSAHQVAVLRYDGAADDEWPSAEWPTWEYERRGLQMNALNRGTGLVESVSMAELTSLHTSDARLLQPHADFQFYVYYDFYDRNNPHFNFPSLYGNENMTMTAKQFIMPQLNRITMHMPSSPLLVARDRLDAGTFCNDTSLAAQNVNCSLEFCECSHMLRMPLNATVELVLVDEGYRFDANHPFHLHGHGFQVVAMERLRPTGITVEEIKELDKAGRITRRLAGAPTKDTITVPDGGYTIVRFVADNPGYWLFHCHIEFHSEVGMSIVFKVGEHEQMPPVPRNFPQCGSYMPRLGDDDNDDSGALARAGEWSGWKTIVSAVGAVLLGLHGMNGGMILCLSGL